MPRLVIVPEGGSVSGLSVALPLSGWVPVTLPESLADAFMELRDPLCRYLLALGLARTEAEEVVQETFLRLCQHLAGSGPQANLRGWVFAWRTISPTTNIAAASASPASRSKMSTGIRTRAEIRGPHPSNS